ncbi:hypothetical protein CONCODRAFT_6769, partial [Conidiobolus coronatus NRRL 28638]
MVPRSQVIPLLLIALIEGKQFDIDQFKGAGAAAPPPPPPPGILSGPLAILPSSRGPFNPNSGRAGRGKGGSNDDENIFVNDFLDDMVNKGEPIRPQQQTPVSSPQPQAFRGPQRPDPRVVAMNGFLNTIRRRSLPLNRFRRQYYGGNQDYRYPSYSYGPKKYNRPSYVDNWSDDPSYYRKSPGYYRDEVDDWSDNSDEKPCDEANHNYMTNVDSDNNGPEDYSNYQKYPANEKSYQIKTYSDSDDYDKVDDYEDSDNYDVESYMEKVIENYSNQRPYKSNGNHYDSIYGKPNYSSGEDNDSYDDVDDYSDKYYKPKPYNNNYENVNYSAVSPSKSQEEKMPYKSKSYSNSYSDIDDYSEVDDYKVRPVYSEKDDYDDVDDYSDEKPYETKDYSNNGGNKVDDYRDKPVYDDKEDYEDVEDYSSKPEYSDTDEYEKVD